ncbi:MAG: hypothetical protein ACMUJM_04445 [bacterium]
MNEIKTGAGSFSEQSRLWMIEKYVKPSCHDPHHPGHYYRWADFFISPFFLGWFYKYLFAFLLNFSYNLTDRGREAPLRVKVLYASEQQLFKRAVSLQRRGAWTKIHLL